MSGTLLLTDVKIKVFVTELGHNDHLKIYVNLSKMYVDPGFKSIQMTYSLKTTSPMVLKFHMRQDKATGLRNDKI